jgi:hypothetical protein
MARSQRHVCRTIAPEASRSGVCQQRTLISAQTIAYALKVGIDSGRELSRAA